MIPADLLTACRQAWDDVLEHRRGARLPQRAGDRARADRDDQLHDGLRHDRRRARLLTGEVEEARRRRRDHDREQVGADGAREARLHAGRRRRDRRVRRRAEHGRRRAVREVRALSGVRLRGRRPGDPLHGPHEDDGRSPAVHLRRDLEDREPAGDGDGRRGGEALRRLVEARREGDRDLPRQLQGRAAAVGQEGRRRSDAARRRDRSSASAGVAQAPPAGRPRRGRPQVPRRRLRGLHPRRSVRGQHARATSSWTSPRRARPSPA